jgi:phosphoglycerate dehydrogenase-like enzyme
LTPVLLHPRHGPGLDKALAAIPGVRLRTPRSADQLVTAIEKGAPVLVTYDWDRRFLVPSLRWVQAISAGVDQFPLSELTDWGIVLTSARGAHSPAVAEHALTLVMALLRRLPGAIDRARDREWRPEMATELAGRTATILGFGSIGQQIAQRLSALGAEVIGVRRKPEPAETAGQVVGTDQLHWALQQSSILVVCLPETAATHGTVGSEELRALGRGWLVNVGRGSTLDENALVRALQEGQLLGAALDVTATEPLPPHSPLWDLEKVIITPHMAWATDRLNPRLVEVVSANLIAYRGEGEWVNRVT